MAHQIPRSAVDALAAAEANTDPARPDSEITLACGATGESVTQLVNVLKLLGYATSDVAHGAPPILDQGVLADVHAAQTALGVTEPALLLPTDIPVGVRGELVGQATWNALYAAAEAKVAAELPPEQASAQGAPPA